MLTHEYLEMVVQQLAQTYSLCLRDKGDSVEVYEVFISAAEPLVVTAVVWSVIGKGEAKSDN